MSTIEQRAARYDYLRSGVALRQGVPTGVLERFIPHPLAPKLRAALTFRFWGSPEDMDAAIDKEIEREAN